MHIKNQKQTQTFMQQKQKKSKKLKNPYNINISFNINNPKKVISNQINKTIKVNHYSIAPQDSLNKPNKINISKVLNAPSKNHSASFSRSKDFSKYQCFKDPNKYECYLQNQLPVKKHKKSKSKPYDIETKSKSDFTYNTSILNMPFPGNDPLPDAAVKRLNKMKKYFLQKIGSMDITMPEDIAEPNSDLIHQSKNLKTSEIKLHDSKNQRKSISGQKNQDNDDMITQKLSEYQYENLISYENQNEQRNIDSALKSKELFNYEANQTFPQIVLDNMNSMTIKNEYLRHHSKFLSQNMNLFQNNSHNKQTKKSKRSDKISFEQFQSEVKSKLLNPFQSSYRKPQKKHSKQTKSKHLLPNQQSETKALREKIKIVQDLLMKNDSSQSILKIGDQKSEKFLENKLETRSKVQDFYKKDIKKEYVIKTEIQLPNDLVNEIKQFQSQTLTLLEGNQKLSKENKKAKSQIEEEINQIQKCSYMQFLNSRDEETDKKPTKQLIQNYIDLLKEHLSLEQQIKNIGKQQFMKEVSSVAQIQYISSEKSLSQKQYQPSLSDKYQQQSIQDDRRVSSQVSSYIYGEEQNVDSSSQMGYSRQRMHKIQLQKQMRQQLVKRLDFQFHQRVTPEIEKEQLKIITNSNLLEHSVKENNSDLEYRKKTQDIYEIERQNKLSKQKQAKQSEIQAINTNQALSQQMDTLLGFIKQNINFNRANKHVLRDLYQKLTKMSVTQFNSMGSHQVNNEHESHLSNIAENCQQIKATPQQKLIQTPKKPQPTIKNYNSHKRSYSTQKQQTKLPTHLVSSDDINLWDLILVEERLNKKYNEITYEKQKQIFQIQTDPTLTFSQCQQKIDELQKWENQTKRQILLTKKQIKFGIQNLRKILTPQSHAITFKMKSLSEKHLISHFNSNKFSIKNVQKQTQNNSLSRIDEQLKDSQEKLLAHLQTNKVQQESIEKQLDDTSNGMPKLSVNLDSIFIQDSDQLSQKQRNPKFEKKNQQSGEDNGLEILSQNKSSQKSNNQKSPQNLTQRFDEQSQNTLQSQRIHLFRTGTSRYKDLLQNHQTESLGSQKSSNSSQIYNNQKIYQQNLEEKQQFIDLMKIEKYKLGNYNEFSEDVEIRSIEDGINTQHQTQTLQQRFKQYNKSIQDYNITQDDKVDICEFILLDLCIQMYQETLDLEDSQIKKGSCKKTSAHRIMNDIFSFIKKEKKKPKKKGPKIGIHTQLQTVKDYVQKIKIQVTSLQQKFINKIQPSSQNHLLINRINTPIGPSAEQILKTMRFYEDQIFQYREQENSPEFSQNNGLNSLILPVYVFTDFEEKLQGDKQFVFETYFEDPQKQKNRLAFLKNVTHVHHKAIFDALNQMLDFERPFGIWGKPFPWKKKSDRQKQLRQEDLQISLKKSSDKVVECAMYMCGLLIDKEESLVKNTSVSEAYIEEVKQDRMSKMIINDFLENENRFYFMDDEETQILLETSYVVWLLLIQQALKQFDSIYHRNL